MDVDVPDSVAPYRLPKAGAHYADGYDFFDLVESSDIPVPVLCDKIQTLIDRYIEEPSLRRLVLKELVDNALDAAD